MLAPGDLGEEGRRRKHAPMRIEGRKRRPAPAMTRAPRHRRGSGHPAGRSPGTRRGADRAHGPPAAACRRAAPRADRRPRTARRSAGRSSATRSEPQHRSERSQAAWATCLPAPAAAYWDRHRRTLRRPCGPRPPPCDSDGRRRWDIARRPCGAGPAPATHRRRDRQARPAPDRGQGSVSSRSAASAVRRPGLRLPRRSTPSGRVACSASRPCSRRTSSRLPPPRSAISPLAPGKAETTPRAA